MLFVDRDWRWCGLTFAEMASRGARWASLLRRRGPARGDRVLVLLERSTDPTLSPSVLSA